MDLVYASSLHPVDPDSQMVDSFGSSQLMFPDSDSSGQICCHYSTDSGPRVKWASLVLASLPYQLIPASQCQSPSLSVSDKNLSQWLRPKVVLLCDK